MPKEIPPIIKLLECLSICPMSGNAYWKRRPEHHFPNGWMKTWNTRYSGKMAATRDANGYLRCRIDHQHYPIHRLMWTVFHGLIPQGMEIDHINGNRADNRLMNLRLVNNQQQGMNRGLSARNKSGHAGVFFHKKRQRWTSLIRVDGKLKHLGYFHDIKDAIECRKAAEVRYFGEYNRKTQN